VGFAGQKNNIAFYILKQELNGWTPAKVVFDRQLPNNRGNRRRDDDSRNAFV